MHRELRTRSRDPFGYDSPWLIPTCAALMLGYYLVLITHLGFGRTGFDLPFPFVQFNDMLDHLLRGRFDVDPDIVGVEGYAHDGRVYAYWGIFPALLRVVLLPIPGWWTLDVTVPSCVVAATLNGVVKIAALREFRRNVPDSRFANTMFAALLVTVVFGSSNVPYLKATVYQEVIFWASAFASCFVLCCIRGLLRETAFSSRLLSTMAACAGLALLTRASTGLGLYVALGLLLAWLALRRGGVMQRRFVAASMILLLCAAMTGGVNWMRFNNPLTFADFTTYLVNQHFPDRIPRLQHYGVFSPARIWYGLLYYFVPVWFLIRPDGHLLLADTDFRLMDMTEMPPSSFFATDLMLIGLSVACVWIVMRHWMEVSRRVDTGAMVANAAGLTVPPLLILMFGSFAFRYRVEFYPLLDFTAYMAVFLLAGGARVPQRMGAIWPIVGLSVLASHAELLLYQLSDFGPAREWLEQNQTDWTRMYFWRAMRMFGLL